jgi:hypothetical protein
LQSYPKRHKKPAQCGFFVACDFSRTILLPG